MFKIILIIVAVLVVAIVILAIVIARRPDDFRVTRSATIAAAPSAVFAEVDDFHRWKAWSPWERMDPALQRTYEGPASGPGAIYRWVGNDQVGEGSMTILESRPGELVRIALVFIKPFASTCTAEFAFAPTADGKTTVTWSMAGKNNFMAKVACLFMDMDKMVGGQFEQGLGNLAAVVQSPGVQAPAADVAPTAAR